ncbi:MULTISPECIES: hypothetical protein [unclassified Ruegeria]|uniref:hypothetical protein n=1 Tax=unclassified Ruegeria TaxID=2625375 RepID=UPI001489F742|nr:MULTISPECIES: hypothetical protein [unclassified Ruegeria]NOC85618.1 hypothetical protein [Ruegeria sp. HKCCD6428]
MSQPTTNQLDRLWRSGFAMTQAWVVYAEPKLKERWEELQRSSAISALEDGMTKASAMEADAVTKFQMLLEGPQKILEARNTVRQTLQENILKYIAGGHLHAYGFEPPRKVASTPIAIPNAAWSGRCNWDEGKLSFRGLEFIEVRLTTNCIRNEILERGHVDTTPSRAPGRPSVKSDIEAAFHALHEAGEIDPTASQMSHYPKVRRWLELNRPDLDVPPAQMSDKTIHRIFSPFFNDLKKISNL